MLAGQRPRQLRSPPATFTASTGHAACMRIIDALLPSTNLPTEVRRRRPITSSDACDFSDNLDDVVRRFLADRVHDLVRDSCRPEPVRDRLQLLFAGPAGIDGRVAAGAVHDDEVLVAQPRLGDSALERCIPLGLGLEDARTGA